MSERLREWYGQLEQDKDQTIDLLLANIADKGNYHVNLLSDPEVRLIKRMLHWPQDKTGPGMFVVLPVLPDSYFPSFHALSPSFFLLLFSFMCV